MEELDGPAVSALAVQSRKLSNVVNNQSWDHHQPINVPTTGAQAFLMNYT
jgi:hypothetical protein